MHLLHSTLRFGRLIEDLSAADLAPLTVDDALVIAESGEHRWHCTDIDQE